MGKQKDEADEADLQAAYDRARSIGLFLVEKYAREVLRHHDELAEFVMGMGCYSFWDSSDSPFNEVDFAEYGCKGCTDKLDQLIEDWDDALKLTGEPMRFTADGPVRREW